MFILREAFDYPYRRIAQVLGLGEPNARQLAARGRAHLAGGRCAPVDAGERRRLVEAVVAATRNGRLAALEQLLAADVACSGA